MSDLIQKDFFIVFERDKQNKIDLVFNVNLFYLKSMKKGNISFVETPIFKGKAIFGSDFKNKIRPLKFEKFVENNNLKPLDPSLLQDLMFSKKNNFIAFSNRSSSEDIASIVEMLENFHYDKEKILRLTFCASCLQENRFTILSDSTQITSFQDQIICSKCALDLVLREAKVSGLLREDHINPKLKNFFNHMILKFRDVNKVLNSFREEFNPEENKDLTLYDVEEITAVAARYLNRKVSEIDIPNEFKKVLEAEKIDMLLPIQAIALDRGLISGRKDQLIMSPTSSGKTLIGELAGVARILRTKHSKMLYLVPIVALANVRTEEFKRKYNPLNLKVVKKVGESLFEKRDEGESLEELLTADIVIATYEAIDHVLRSGNRIFLGDVGTVIIDEIQTLIDEERGYLLDGFIARLKTLFNESQFLYLSATLGEPEQLSRRLDCALIKYNNRPVPIQRHLMLCVNELYKQKFLVKLVKNAFSQTSEYGYKGQSIVFTNTRKKCEGIAAYLRTRGIRAKAYHSGLTNEERKIIESEFQAQQISSVVATAALAAGVDFPARQVIFESLAMGINWLTVAEFEQMLGRAGRLKKHSLGLAYLLVEPGKKYNPKMKESEENIAIRLLNGKIKDFELEPNENNSLTELLAFISMFSSGVTEDKVEEFFDYLINNNYYLDSALKKLRSHKLIALSSDSSWKTTQLGQAIGKSFITVEESLQIVEELKRNEKSVTILALNLNPLKNVYLSKSVVADLSKNVSNRFLSNNLFSATALSLMNAEYVKKRKTFSPRFIQLVLKWVKDIFNCSCKDSPYCECGRVNLMKIILDLRAEQKYSIEDICFYMEEHYEIVVFKGDIIDFLENLIYSFESIKSIAEGVINLSQTYKDEISGIPLLIKKIKS